MCYAFYGMAHCSEVTTQVVAIEFFESCYKRRLSDASVGCNPENPTRKQGFLGKHKNFEGFDPGSERTLAAWIRHASRTNPWGQLWGEVAKGAVRRG